MKKKTGVILAAVLVSIIFLITAGMIIVFAFPSWFGTTLIGGFLAEEKVGSSEDKVVAEFGDSSFIIENRSAHTSVHILSDDFAVLCQSGPFMSDRSFGVPVKTEDGSYSLRLTDGGYDAPGMKRYGLSADGGYFIFVSGGMPGSRCYTLYDVKNKTVKAEYGTLSGLYDATEASGTDVPVWYTVDGGVYAEKLIWSGGGYRLCFACPGVAAFKKGERDLFAGNIDRFYSDADIAAFHIAVDDDDAELRRLIYENPVLPDSGESPVTEKRGFILRREVYCDKYVVFDLNDGKYELFDTVDGAEAHLEKLGIKPAFEKTAYDKPLRDK